MRASVTGDKKMNRQRNLIIGGSLVVAIALLGVGQATLEGVALSQTVRAPVFEIDP